MINKIIREFWLSTVKPGHAVFLEPRDTWIEVQILIRAFYCALFFFACWNFDTSIERFDSKIIDPLWPIVWIHWTGNYIGIRAILLFYLFGPLVAIWRTDIRLFRIAAFFGLLFGMALDNSFGKINNHLHLWTCAAFIFVFLPDRKKYFNPDEFTALGAVKIFWSSQAVILLTYTMSGIAKILGGIVQIHRGDLHTLISYDALSRHVADRLIQTGEKSLLGSVIINHPYLSWPLFLGALYLEVFSFWICFRPQLFRVWGLALIFLHLGILLTMNVTFSHSMLLLSLFFLASPFCKRDSTTRLKWESLPLFGPLIRVGLALLETKPLEQKTILFYDGKCEICNKWVQFLLNKKIPSDLYFATLHGKTFETLSVQYPILSEVDSLIIYNKRGEQETILYRSEAVFWLLSRVCGLSRIAIPFNLAPIFFSDLVYRWIAKLRHRIDGGKTECQIIPPEYKHLFINESN